MLKLKQAVIVEGKYDKIKLESVLDAVILVTDGFGIYKNKEKMALIKAFAEKDGIIILTDSDHAGFQIRNHLKNVIKKGKVWHVYIPDIYGREKRKDKPAKEGKLGVEGVDIKILNEAFARAGINETEFLDNYDSDSETRRDKTKRIREKLYDDGFIGQQGAAERKKALLRSLSLPENISTPALIDILAVLYTEEEYEAAVMELKMKII